MRKHYFLFLFILCTRSIFGQGIVFETGPLDRVLQKAQKSRKLVFLFIDSPTCSQCTEVATKGFSDPALTEKFAVNFVSYRVSGGSPEGQTLLKKYELSNPLVSLFLTADGSLLHRHDGSTSFAYTYIQEADKAIAKRNRPALNLLNKQYEEGDRSLAFLRTYIERRQEVRLPIDDLLDTYLRQLPKDSLRAESTMRFLIDQAPILNTYADTIMRKDWQAWTTLFMSYPLQKRIEFNRAVNRKTQQKAIATKNEWLALKNAQYTAGTYGENRLSRQWSYESNLMGYYLGVKDTSMYIRTARRFYDTYIMPLDPDSVVRAERQRQFANARPKPGETQMAVSMGPPQHGISLNQVAWKFWQLATKPDDLEKALVWSKRSLDYSPEEMGWMDTYAHILYKLGRRDEAIEQQQKAVALAKQKGVPFSSFEKTLQNMQNGTLVPETD